MSDWTDPPDPPGPPRAAPIRTDGLPEVVRGYISAIGDAVQVPAEMVLLPTLCSLSATQLGGGSVRLKRTYSEPLNLYGLTISAPGTRKSSVFQHVTEALREHEREQVERIGAKRRDALAVVRARELALDRTQRAYAKGDANEFEVEQAQREVDAARSEVPLDPKRIVQDVTPEALGRHMMDTGGVAALFNAEGDSLRGFVGRYKDGGGLEGEILKKGYTGEPLDAVRLGREHVYIERAALSVCLMTQPGVIARLSSTDAMRDEGVWGRFLFVRVGEVFGERVSVFDEPDLDQVAVGRFNRVLRRLVSSAGTSEAFQPFQDLASREIEFSAGAKDVAREWHDVIERRLSEGEEWSTIRDWGGKAEGHAYRVAALLQIAENADSGVDPYSVPISPENTLAAFELVDDLSSHARAELQGLTPSDFDATLQRIWGEILEIGSHYKVSDYQQKIRGRKGFETRDSLDPYFDELQRRNCLYIYQVPTGGRPEERWDIHPDCLALDTRKPRKAEKEQAA